MIIDDEPALFPATNDDCPPAESSSITSTTNTDTCATNAPLDIGAKRKNTRKSEQSTTVPGESPVKRQKQDNQTELTSKTAKALEKVLGRSPDVEKFEKLKQSLMANPTSKYNQDRYKTQLAHVRVKTLKAYKQLNSELKEYQNQKAEPYVTKTKQLHIAAELLKSWKITVHLI